MKLPKLPLQINIHKHVHVHHDNGLESKINLLLNLVTQLRTDSVKSAFTNNKIETLMSKLTDAMAALQAKVAELKTVEDSAVTFIQGIKQQLTDALANEDPDDQAAAIQAVIDGLNDGETELTNAIANAPTAQ